MIMDTMSMIEEYIEITITIMDIIMDTMSMMKERVVQMIVR